MEELCRHTVEVASQAASECLARMSQLQDRQEISTGDVLVARRRLASVRQHTHHLLYQVARQHEDAARVHLRAEQAHLRAVRLALGDADAHSDAANRPQATARHGR